MAAETRTTLTEDRGTGGAAGPLANLAPPYWAAFHANLLQQSWVYLAAALLLHSFRAELFVLVALAGHWLLILLIAVRRPTRPSRADLRFCEFGFVPILLLTCALGPVVWSFSGDRTLAERWFGKLVLAEAEALLPFQLLAGVWLVGSLVLEMGRWGAAWFRRGKR